MARFLVAALVPGLAPAVVRADATGVEHHAPRLTAVRTDRPPKIDGLLDEAAWQDVPVETSFTQNFPDEGQPPTERTELRVLYDDEALYVAVRCFDSRPEAIVARLTRRDRDIDADKVTIDVSSKNDRTSAYHFQVNAAGVQLDGIRFNDTDLGTDWDGRWYAATARDATGWTAEIAIPLVTLRYDGDVSSFGFQVRRYLQRRGEIDEWAFVPRTVKGEVSYYGTMDGIAGLRARRLAELLVYDAGRFTLRGGQGVLDGHDLTENLGADLNLGLTPALTLAATFNPDFGTVEADQVVLNLSTIETYLPEKRPFFLEGADLFATRFTLFYSRRIGAQPPAPSLGSGAALTSPVADGRIWGALKLSGLIADRLSIGVLDALTAREDAAVSRAPGAAPESLLVEPLTNFAVLRLRRDVGASSSIGLLGSAVNRLEPENAAAPAATDLCPVPYSTTFAALVAPPPAGGRCTSDAYTGGLDGTWRTSDGEWGAWAQVVGSVIENGPTRLIPDGTQIGSGTMGWGIMSEAGRYGGENWLFKLGYSAASAGLQINDAGFLDQANFHDGYASLMWRTTRPTPYFLNASVELFFEHRRDFELMDSLNTDPHVSITVQLANLWTLYARLAPYYPRWVENRETQDGARTERIGGSAAFFDVKSDPNRPVVVDVNGSIDSRLRGHEWRATATLSLRPFAALELDLIPNLNWTNGAPRWVATEANRDASRTYFFGDLDSFSLDVTLRGTYAFTRTLSLQAYLQPFVASGHYSKITGATAAGRKPFLALDSFVDATLPEGVEPDFREGELNLNLFLRWEYLPLSALWLVYTRNQEQTPYDPAEGAGRIRLDRFAGGPSTDVLLVKLSYLWF